MAISKLLEEEDTILFVAVVKADLTKSFLYFLNLWVGFLFGFVVFCSNSVTLKAILTVLVLLLL